MASVNITLADGLQDSNGSHKEVVMRAPTAADIIEAGDESEVLRAGDKGQPVLLMSDHRFGLNVLRRQVVKVGNINGPLTLGMLARLSQRDLLILQRHADALDSAMADSLQKDIKQRGRAEGDGGNG